MANKNEELYSKKQILCVLEQCMNFALEIEGSYNEWTEASCYSIFKDWAEGQYYLKTSKGIYILNYHMYTRSEITEIRKKVYSNKLSKRELLDIYVDTEAQLEVLKTLEKTAKDKETLSRMHRIKEVVWSIRTSVRHRLGLTHKQLLDM